VQRLVTAAESEPRQPPPPPILAAGMAGVWDDWAWPRRASAAPFLPPGARNVKPAINASARRERHGVVWSPTRTSLAPVLEIAGTPFWLMPLARSHLVADSPFTASLAALSLFFVGDATVEDTLDRVAGLAVEAIEPANMAGVTMVVEGARRTPVFTHA